MRARNYLATLAVMNFRELGALRLTTINQIVFMLINNLVFFVFWIILYQNVDTIRGFKLEDVAFMFALSASAFGLGLSSCGGALRLADVVSSGRVDVYLTQPRDVQFQVLTSRTHVSAWGDLLSGVVMVGFYCGADLTAWLYWGAGSVIGAVVFVATISIFQSLIFWLPRSERLSEQLMEFLISFSLYPNSIFSGTTRALTYTLLPAAYISFLPAVARIEGSPFYLGASALAAVVYYALARSIFYRGLRRYESGAGFVGAR